MKSTDMTQIELMIDFLRSRGWIRIFRDAQTGELKYVGWWLVSEKIRPYSDIGDNMIKGWRDYLLLICDRRYAEILNEGNPKSELPLPAYWEIVNYKRKHYTIPSDRKVTKKQKKFIERLNDERTNCEDYVIRLSHWHTTLTSEIESGRFSLPYDLPVTSTEQETKEAEKISPEYGYWSEDRKKFRWSKSKAILARGLVSLQKKGQITAQSGYGLNKQACEKFEIDNSDSLHTAIRKVWGDSPDSFDDAAIEERIIMQVWRSLPPTSSE